jgi:hypothetical protein
MEIPQPPRTDNQDYDAWLHKLIRLLRNIFKGQASEFASFTDQDATPDVGDGNCFTTANTLATTITDFDSGRNGQTITVVFGDGLTTIDFTGTNLKGNVGADWSPAQSDHMVCTYDGTYWYCIISDNTV